MQPHKIVSEEEWLAARKALLAKEKAFTRERDALSAERRALPWVRVDKTYVFEGPDGKETLAQLFGDRSQLLVYHFMFGPDWNEGCPSCSFWADNYDDAVVHLRHRDVALVAISRAPLAKLEAYKKRMGWHFKWVSSYGNDFNRDYHVSFTPEEQKTAVYNYKARRLRHVGGAGHQRVRQGRGRAGISHLLVLRARPRHAERHLSPARPRAQGPRRAGPAVADGLGAPPRQVRRLRAGGHCP